MFNFKKLNKNKGNNDNQADFSDYINLDINLKNIGTTLQLMLLLFSLPEINLSP